jgi:beta-lactamase class A
MWWVVATSSKRCLDVVAFSAAINLRRSANLKRFAPRASQPFHCGHPELSKLAEDVAAGASAFVLRAAFAFNSKTTSEALARMAAFEREHGGKLSVVMLDTGCGQRMARRGDIRFPICSTFKLLAVAAIPARVHRGAEQRDQPIVFGKVVVLNHAPIIHQHLDPSGMSVALLCKGAITMSDQTAAHLLLASTGGLAVVTVCVRRMFDTVTRRDRIEPELNIDRQSRRYLGYHDTRRPIRHAAKAAAGRHAV